MRKLLMAGLVAGQALGQGAPAFAQGLAPAHETRLGAFGGLRLSVPFGGARREPVRAGLAVAPAARTETQDGRAIGRIGEGLELGYRTDRPLSVSMAGRDLSSFRLGAAQDSERPYRHPEQGGWAIVVGGLVVIGALVGVGLLVF